MSTATDQILRQALALPPEERAELVEQLLATFQTPHDPELDRLWAQEAHDRLDAFDRGDLSAVSIEEVFKGLANDKSK